MKRIFKVSSLIILLLFCISCGSNQTNDNENRNNNKTAKIEVYLYDGNLLEFKKINISSETQQEIFEEINKLSKSEPLYANGEYQGLESAFDENSYLIKVFDDIDFTIEIIEDNPYYGDNMYWYNVESENKDIEGIYKVSYNLKDRIKHIIFEK